MKDIGSIYPIYTLDVPEGSSGPLPFDHEPNVRYFSLCREALSAIARSLNKKQGKVLIPAYTCQTVITPFQELGWECRYYGITEDLRIDEESLKSLFAEVHPDVVVVHPYYGRDLNEDELAALYVLKDSRCVFIADLTQCLFSKQRDEVFDYYVGSMRKWFPIPDGAFAFSSRHQLREDDKCSENVKFVTAEIDAMFLRGIYYESGDVRLKEISRRVNSQAVDMVSSAVCPHLMSHYSRAVFSHIDISKIQDQRKDNYSYLFECLRDCGKYRLFSETTTAPLYFPMVVTNRECLIERMISLQVYPPVLWPVVTKNVLVSNVVRSVYGGILALPCDQRYERSDLERVVGGLL